MKIVRYLWLMCVMLIIYSTSSYSAVVLDIENGVLKGATGVIVNGNTYNISFQDGSCFDLFDGCNESSDFFFPVSDASVPTLASSEAFIASQALLDQVFLDSDSGQFDSDPTQTFGCNNGGVCDAWTPVFLVSDNLFHAISVRNSILESIDSPGIVFGIPINGDTNPFLPNPGSDTAVFAIWSNPVPIPAAIWLFCSGIIGLIGIGIKTLKVSTLSVQ